MCEQLDVHVATDDIPMRSGRTGASLHGPSADLQGVDVVEETGLVPVDL